MDGIFTEIGCYFFTGRWSWHRWWWRVRGSRSWGVRRGWEIFERHVRRYKKFVKQTLHSRWIHNWINVWFILPFRVCDDQDLVHRLVAQPLLRCYMKMSCLLRTPVIRVALFVAMVRRWTWVLITSPKTQRNWNEFVKLAVVSQWTVELMAAWIYHEPSVIMLTKRYEWNSSEMGMNCQYLHFFCRL